MKMRMTNVMRLTPNACAGLLGDLVLELGLTPSTVACPRCIRHYAAEESLTPDGWAPTWTLTPDRVLMSTGPCAQCAALWRLENYLYGPERADFALSQRGIGWND